MKRILVPVLATFLVAAVSVMNTSCSTEDSGKHEVTKKVEEQKTGAQQVAPQDESAPGVSEEMKEPAGKAANASEESEKSRAADELAKMKENVAEAKKLVVARVNGADISMYNLVRAMNKVAPKYIKQGQEVTPELTEKIKKEALDLLIYEELAVQEAVRRGINPDPKRVEQVVKRVKESLGSEKAYKDYLDRFGFTEESFKKQIERGHRFESITAREVYDKVKVDEKLVRDAYEKEKEKFWLPDKFLVDDVWILNSKDANATHLERANRLLAEIKKNNNDVWSVVLDGTFIVRTIYVKEPQHPAMFKAVKEGMEEGDLSPVVKDRDGLHIFRVKKKEPARYATFEEAKATLERRFRVPAQEKRKKEWEAELRKDAKIEILLDEVEKQMKEKAEAEKAEEAAGSK